LRSHDDRDLQPMNPPENRRAEVRRAANARGVVIADGFEMGCLIVDMSTSGMRLRLDRNLALPKRVLVVDIAAGTACEAEVAWTKGNEAGFKCHAQSALRGLVPARLASARDAWLRAGGR